MPQSSKISCSCPVACFSRIRSFLLSVVAIFGCGHIRKGINLDKSGMFGVDSA